MQRVRRPLFVLHSSPTFQQRVRQAAAREFEIEFFLSWEVLRARLRQSASAAMVVVDAYHPGGGEARPAPELGELLREFPSAAVLAAVELRPERYADLLVLSQWGVKEVIGVGQAEVAMLAGQLRAAWARPLRDLIERSLPEWISTRGRSILAAAAEVAAGGGQVEDLARRLYTSERTLLRWCGKESLPVPRQLLAWMRILLAAERLESSGSRIGRIATACGYASVSGLRRAFYDVLGMSPRELRKRGALATALAAFQRALREARQGAREGREWGVRV